MKNLRKERKKVCIILFNQVKLPDLLHFWMPLIFILKKKSEKSKWLEQLPDLKQTDFEELVDFVRMSNLKLKCFGVIIDSSRNMVVVHLFPLSKIYLTIKEKRKEKSTLSMTINDTTVLFIFVVHIGDIWRTVTPITSFHLKSMLTHKLQK